MKKTLFAAAATVGLMFGASSAQAFDWDDPILSAAVGLSANVGGVVGGNVSGSGVTYDTNKIHDDAFKEAKGTFNVGQNNGANALVQNSLALSAILGCECDDSLVNLTVAASVNAGLVQGNTAISLASSNLNTIHDSAFKEAVGVFNVAQNNGVNAMVQNSMAVSAITKGGSR